MDIATWLHRSQSLTSTVRNEAETTLRRLEAENYPAYILGLCAVFNGTQTRDVSTQRLAAILLKNTLQSKDADVKGRLKAKWTALPTETRREIHRELLRGLHHGEVDVCCTVSLVIPPVAAIDLPRGEWPELIPTLLQNMEVAPAQLSLQRSTLETIGYVCEELAEQREFALPSEVVDRMLTAIVRGMTEDGKDPSLRQAATQALLNALEFTEKNFTHEHERNVIMSAVARAVQGPSADVRGLGFECLARICQVYYNLMVPYMMDLYRLTIEAIQSDEEDIAKQAIEVWSTICEEEIELIKDLTEGKNTQDLLIHYFAKQAAPSLVPVLLDQLTKQDEDQEVDEGAWTVAMAAGSCLSLMAECIGNPIIPIVMPYVQSNIRKHEGPDDWRVREAATFALGAIQEGPDESALAPFATSGISFLLGAMQDQDARVRNTTAWTIGRIFQFVHPEELAAPTLTKENVQAVVECMHHILVTKDEMHILERVCYVIEQLAGWCRDQSGVSLAPYFKNLIEALLKLAFHPVESSSCPRFQVAAFETINALVRAAGSDSLDLVVQLIPFLSQKLSESLHVRPAETREHVAEMQGMICGCLTVVFHRLSASDGHKIPLNQCASQIFALLSDVLQANGADVAVMEEAMNALAALVSAGVNFLPHVRSFVLYLEKGLRNNGDKYAFLSCVGAISDIFSNLGADMEPYSQTLLSILCDTLSSTSAHRDIKPPVLSLLGDICLAISDRFRKFLPVVRNILRQATVMAVCEMPNMDEEDIEYVNELMLGIIEAYTGIVQGLSTPASQSFMTEEFETLMKFMNHLSRDRTRTAAVTKEAVDLLGDIMSKMSPFDPDLTQQRWIERFIQECLETPKENVRRAAERTRSVYARAVHS